MRAALFVGAALTLALAFDASAQSLGTQFMSNFNGVNPRNINMVPIDTNKAMKNFNVNKAFRAPAQPKPFSLTNIFSKVHMPTWPPIVPSTPILNRKNNLFQPNPMIGRDAFGQIPK